jgi:3-phenylpropionate/cinnamic acid dioxygenase small subunit
MPVRVNRERAEGSGFSEDSFYFEETLGSLELRVRRFETEFAWAEDPPSRTRHFVTNVRVAPGEEEDEVVVRSNLLLYRSRGSAPDHDLLSAERKDVLRKEDGQWKLRRRVIYLDHHVLETHNLSVFL